jgi:hypothetical protein
MSPILGARGGLAASAYGFTSAVAVGYYESIATVTVGGAGAATISFTSIPATFKHLQVRYIGRDNRASASDDLMFRLNSDATTANYNSHRLYADGSAVSADRVTGFAGTLSAFVTGATAGASMFGAGITDILDYANTNKYKTTRSIGGNDQNGSGFVSFISGLWMSTSAITNIEIIPLNGTLFNQYSSFALYGIK